MSLSPKRPYRETRDVAAATRRLIRVVGRRVAEEDVEALGVLADLEGELRAAWTLAIAGLRAAGYSDTDIGRVLGTTKQAVAQRWPRRPIGRTLGDLVDDATR